MFDDQGVAFERVVEALCPWRRSAVENGGRKKSLLCAVQTPGVLLIAVERIGSAFEEAKDVVEGPRVKLQRQHRDQSCIRVGRRSDSTHINSKNMFLLLLILHHRSIHPKPISIHLRRTTKQQPIREKRKQDRFRQVHQCIPFDCDPFPAHIECESVEQLVAMLPRRVVAWWIGRRDGGDGRAGWSYRGDGIRHVDDCGAKYMSVWSFRG